MSTKMMERESDSDARDNLNLLREVVFRWRSPAHLPLPSPAYIRAMRDSKHGIMDGGING